MTCDVAILGAGAAGLFLAANTKLDTILIDHNQTQGKKIAISGGGRANVTNKKLSPDHYRSGDETFLRQAFARFDNEALLRWLRKRGCAGFAMKGSGYFCQKSAKELLDLLRPRGRTLYGAEILGVEEGFLVRTSKGDVRARRVVVATGGLSYPRVGASGIGYEIAKSFGHAIVPTRPALVGLALQPGQFWMKELAGVSLKARVQVGKKRFFDNILFAHRGISGPAILNASLYWDRGPIEIGFVDDLRRYLRSPQKVISTQLPLPRRFVKRFLQVLGVEDRPVGTLRPDEWERLRAFERYKFAPAGTFGYERAEVTKGGVALDAIDPATLESRLVPGLYFAGEVLDVTGELGGYNFQWAFSSAWVVKEALERA